MVNDYNVDLEETTVDSTYDPAFMKEDGDCDVDFEWDFQPLTSNNKPKALSNMCNGPGPCLKQGIGLSINIEGKKRLCFCCFHFQFVAFTTLPLMLQAVLNVAIQLGISKCPDGLLRLHMDNQYSALPLFVILHKIHYILCSGSIWMK